MTLCIQIGLPKRKVSRLQTTNFQKLCWFPRVYTPPKLEDWKIPSTSSQHLSSQHGFLCFNKVLLHLLLQGVVPLLSLLVLRPQFLHLLRQATCIGGSRGFQGRPLEMADFPIAGDKMPGIFGLEHVGKGSQCMSMLYLNMNYTP